MSVDIPSKVTLTNVGCSGCNRGFTVVNIDKIDKMTCPKCSEKWFKHHGVWVNEKLREYAMTDAWLKANGKLKKQAKK